MSVDTSNFPIIRLLERADDQLDSIYATWDMGTDELATDDCSYCSSAWDRLRDLENEIDVLRQTLQEIQAAYRAVIR